MRTELEALAALVGVPEPDASATVKGVTKLSVAPVSPTDPIAAGTNDSRLSDQRVPTNGSVTNAKVAAGAAIAYGKLALTLSVVNGDIASGAAIAYAKLNLSGAIVLGDIASSLKPSGSAGATDESLRRLGTGSTHAAAGDDARFPTTGQKNALAGTAGTPGSGNEYATKQTTDALASAAPPANTGLSYGTGWTDFGGTRGAGGHYKHAGRVYLVGAVKRTSGAGTTIATLPVGSRPPADLTLIVGNFAGPTYITISTAGVITSLGAANDATITALGEVSFKL